MKLTIKLDDSKHCDGCPCRWELSDARLICRHYYPQPLGDASKGRAIRLQQCIKENN